jgi:hypothetical protein
MRKLIIVIVSILILSACASAKIYDFLKSPADITEIKLVDFFPLYSSFMPEPRSVVTDKSEIAKLTEIINKAEKATKTKEDTMMGGPGTFDRTLIISGGVASGSMIYVYLESGKAYLSDLDLYDSKLKEFTLYRIRTSDLPVFMQFVNR